MIAKNRDGKIEVENLEQARAWCAKGWIGDTVRVYERVEGKAVRGPGAEVYLRCVAVYKRLSEHELADYDDVGEDGVVEFEPDTNS